MKQLNKERFYVGSTWWLEPAAAENILSAVRKQGEMGAGARLHTLLLVQSRTLDHGTVLPTFKMGLPASQHH